MNNENLIEEQLKVIKEKEATIAQKEQQIKELVEKLAKTTTTKLSKEVEETNESVKKGQKFNVKAWLLASCFAIASCIFGLTNLILNLVKK